MYNDQIPYMKINISNSMLEIETLGSKCTKRLNFNDTMCMYS